MEAFESCGICGADLGPSTSFVWHWPDEDCRGIKDPCTETQLRLEYLRGQLRAESISYGELAELQDLAEHIDPGDVELREAAGLPEA